MYQVPADVGISTFS